MAGHEWEDWFEREEFIGQISDIRVQNLQVEREVVQKRTFTRWMNLHLEKCNPPIEVHDLFRDIQDGRILMALLEELSGCKLLHGFKKSSHRIFRLNNIAKVLSFLEERNVKLISIDAVDVADGNASIILGLIWNIILFFQIKELTGNIRSQFPSSSSLSSIPTSSDSDTSYCSSPSDDRQPASSAMREHSKAIKKLLQWVQKRTRKYGVAVQDFGKSWTSGLAFLAVIKSIDSSLVDMRKALLRSPRENMEDAFRIAHYSLGIPRLLEPEDVTINAPDEQCIMTYLSQFLEHFPGLEELEEPYLLNERSVSMGRLNFRDSDYHVRSGAERRRVRERAYMFQRDCGQPPPKILISSVSEDRTTKLARLRPAAARSWSSEDFLVDSPHMDGISSSVSEDPKEPASEALSNSETNSPERPQTHSPTSSAVPESVTGDSAINSPDSWVGSEFGIMSEKSDSSFCESGAAWDVYRATPVEVTNSDEGFVPSGEDKTPDEQSITESYADEGVYSLSSLESTQEQNQGRPDKKQAENCNQSNVGEQEVLLGVTREVEHESRQTHKGPEEAAQIPNTAAEDHLLKTDETNQPPLSLTCEPAAPTHSEELLNPSLEERTDREPGCLKNFVALTEYGPESEEQNKSLSTTNDAENVEMENECQQIENNRDQSEVLYEPAEEPEAILSDCTETSNTLAKMCPSNHKAESDTSPEQSVQTNTPQIFISSEPEEQIRVEACDLERQAGNEELAGSNGPDTAASSPTQPEDFTCDSSDRDEKTLVEINFCMISENLQTTPCAQNEDVEHTDEHDNAYCSTVDICENMEASAHQQECEFAQNTDKDVTAQTFSVNDTQQSTSDGTTGTLGHEPLSVSTNMDLFHADRSSPSDGIDGEPVEPMDLFYPDKEEPVSTEPLDTDMQSWPSVLSVSALEPAPAAVALGDDHPLGLWSEDHDKAITNEEPECLSAQRTVGWSDDSEAPQQSTELMRPGEDPIPPVLRHRKGRTDRTAVTAGTREADADTQFWCRDDLELYLLLLLWLLLYSFWVLPQMDLKTLPSLLLNLKP